MSSPTYSTLPCAFTDALYFLLLLNLVRLCVPTLEPPVSAEHRVLCGLQAYEKGTEEDEKFVQNLAMFLTTFLKEHLSLIETQPDLQSPLITALTYLINISYVQDAGVPPAACPTPFQGACLQLRALQRALQRRGASSLTLVNTVCPVQP